MACNWSLRMNWLKELWKAKVFRPLCSASLQLPLSELPHKAILLLPNPRTGKSSADQMTSAGAMLRGVGEEMLLPLSPQTPPPTASSGTKGATRVSSDCTAGQGTDSAHLQPSPSQPLISGTSTALGAGKSPPSAAQLACLEVVRLFLFF